MDGEEPDGGPGAEAAGNAGDGNAGGGHRRSRWPWVFGGVLGFGLLVVLSGLMVASIPVTVQGAALLAIGTLGLVVAGGVRRARLPGPVPLALPLGALVLVLVIVENVRSGVSAWAPLGLLVGVALLSVPLRALPPVPRASNEPSAAVVLVVIGLALLFGYQGLRHLATPDAGELLPYLAAVGMPVAAAIGAGALAVLAATRGGVAGIAAAGGLALAAAGLSMSEAAGNSWYTRQPIVVDGGVILIQGVNVDPYSVAVSYEATEVEPAVAALVVGLVLTVVGWWWAAVRRAAG